MTLLEYIELCDKKGSDYFYVCTQPLYDDFNGIKNNVYIHDVEDRIRIKEELEQLLKQYKKRNFIKFIKDKK